MSKRTAISVFMALALLTLLTVPGLAQESVRILISADNFVFDKDQLTVPAGAEVTLVFENKERAPHNVAIYLSSDAEEVVFEGEVFSGPKTMRYRFTAPQEPGTYFFRCDVHPRTMVGDFIVEGS